MRAGFANRRLRFCTAIFNFYRAFFCSSAGTGCSHSRSCGSPCGKLLRRQQLKPQLSKESANSVCSFFTFSQNAKLNAKGQQHQMHQKCAHPCNRTLKKYQSHSLFYACFALNGGNCCNAWRVKQAEYQN